MKRNVCAVIGTFVTMAVLVFLASGCTGSNPVAPAVDNSDIDQYQSPGIGAILIEPVIDADIIGTDPFVGTPQEVGTPEIKEFDPDSPVVPDEFIGGDICSDPAIR